MFLVIRDRSYPVIDEAEASRAIHALLGPVSGHVRKVEDDGLGGWLVESSEQECALLRIYDVWFESGQVGGVPYEVVAEMP